LQSLDRVFALLEVVAAKQPVSASDAGRAAGLAGSSTSRLMRQMCQAGLLERRLDSGSYILGGRVLATAAVAWAGNGVLPAVQRECERLRNLTGETVSLHVRSGLQRICISEVQSTKDVRRVVKVGLAVPLHVGATGAALLGCLPRNEREEYVMGLTLKPRGERELRMRLEQIEHRGWTMAVGLYLDGVSGLAAPVPAHGGTAFAALTVSGPSFRWTEDRMSQHAADLSMAASRITSLYSGDPASSLHLNRSQSTIPPAEQGLGSSPGVGSAMTTAHIETLRRTQ